MWLAAPSLPASSSKQHSHEHSHLSVFELLSIGVLIPDSPHVSDGALSLDALCASISDSTCAKASARVEGHGCASAGVDESSSADDDEDSEFCHTCAKHGLRKPRCLAMLA